MHLSRHIWQALEEGLLSAAEVRRAIFTHGLRCKTCVSEFMAYRAGFAGVRVWPTEDDWTPPKDAAKDLQELSKASLRTMEAIKKMERARTRFAGEELKIALIKEARRLKAEDSGRALHLLLCARRVRTGRRDERDHWLGVMGSAEEADIARLQARHRTAFHIVESIESPLSSSDPFRKEAELPDERDPFVDATIALYRTRLYLEVGAVSDAAVYLESARALTRLGVGNPGDREVRELVEEVNALYRLLPSFMEERVAHLLDEVGA